MTLPFSFPSWMPWWVPVAILVPALLYGLVFLAMPFSLFGLRSRVDALDARLDEIQGEIRALVLRLPEPDWEAEYEAPPRPRREMPPRPPIPPVRTPPRAEGQPVREAGLRNPDEERVRRFAAASERPVAPERTSRFSTGQEAARRAPLPPPPPPPVSPGRRAEPRIDWPRPPS
jgi:hypothetical protein